MAERFYPFVVHSDSTADLLHSNKNYDIIVRERDVVSEKFPMSFYRSPDSLVNPTCVICELYFDFKNS